MTVRQGIGVAILAAFVGLLSPLIWVDDWAKWLGIVAIAVVTVGIFILLEKRMPNLPQARQVLPPAPQAAATATTPTWAIHTTPYKQTEPVQPLVTQSWQATIGKGAAEIDRLVAAGDWDSARTALQHIAYGMVDAEPQAKQQFTQAMCQFAARDPLYHAVLQVVTPLIDATPGMLQSKFYPHLPDVAPETIRYVLYYAAELGAAVRRKKGSSYAMFPKSHAVNA